ncbi:hypothetical protein E4T56_gene14284, partial [Termitomyces sp. T112]
PWTVAARGIELARNLDMAAQRGGQHRMVMGGQCLPVALMGEDRGGQDCPAHRLRAAIAADRVESDGRHAAGQPVRPRQTRELTRGGFKSGGTLAKTRDERGHQRAILQQPFERRAHPQQPALRRPRRDQEQPAPRHRLDMATGVIRPRAQHDPRGHRATLTKAHQFTIGKGWGAMERRHGRGARRSDPVLKPQPRHEASPPVHRPSVPRAGPSAASDSMITGTGDRRAGSCAIVNPAARSRWAAQAPANPPPRTNMLWSLRSGDRGSSCITYPSLGVNQPRHGSVGIKVPRLVPFQRLGVIDLDVIAGAIDVELLAVARHAELEARAAREFGLVHHLVRAKVEVPEFAALVARGALRGDGIAILAIGRDLQTGHLIGGRADGGEIEGFRCQLEPADAKDLVVNIRVCGGKQRDIFVIVAQQFHPAAKAGVLQPGALGLGHVDPVHHLEIGGVQHDDLVAEQIEQLAVGRDHHVRARGVERVVLVGQIDGLDHLLERQIDGGILPLADLVAVDGFVDRHHDRVEIE